MGKLAQKEPEQMGEKMKKRTTHKSIKALPEPKLRVGYCSLQRLLRNHKPFAFTAGVYGWNYDAYDLDGLVITTGYRNMPGEDADDLVEEYEHKADNVRNDAEALEALVAEFREKVLERIA